MKHLFIFSLLFVCIQKTHARQEFGIRINAGISQMITDLNDEDAKQKYSFVFSGLGGFYGSFYISEKSFIGTELLFNRIAGKEEIVIKPQSIAGQPGTQEAIIFNFSRHISYLSLPLYYGFVSDKFIVRGGAQFAMPLESAESLKYKVPYNVRVNYTEPDKLEIDQYDYGFLVGLAYKIDDRTEFEISYYHGLNDIYDGDDGRTVWKNRQLLAGLRYSIFKSEK